MIVENLRHVQTSLNADPRLYGMLVPEPMEKANRLANSLKDLFIVELNATVNGGGVAEMLGSRLGLFRKLGINDKWLVPQVTNPHFFDVTKKIHNQLQGQEGELTNAEQELYLRYNEETARLLDGLSPAPDIVVCHDPQTAAVRSFSNLASRFVWRCHIDTSQPNPQTWKFMNPFLEPYERLVFTLPEYTNGDFEEEQLRFITPVIDPFSPKNRLMDLADAWEYLRSNYGINPDRPLVTQVSRFDPWKDPVGVVQAYRLAKRGVPNLQLALVGNTADDDPESIAIFRRVQKEAGDNPLIHLILENNPDTVRAVQTASDIILQKSIKEGFGLTVTEAMWHRTPVIGGNVGGIRVQIQHGVNGFLVDPNRPEETAKRIVDIYQHPTEITKIINEAYQSVHGNFLLPHSALNWLRLFQELTATA